jgi:RNA recognition motif. (a.k.a. RRM, RBD, or RNP domain)
MQIMDLGQMRWRICRYPVCSRPLDDAIAETLAASLTLDKQLSRALAMAVNDELSAALQEWEMVTMVSHAVSRFPTLSKLSIDRNVSYPPREQLPLPTEPPYTAHIGNMSFDTTEGEISDFFKDCEVTKVRIVEDKMDRKPKGFGYVEFASLDGLKKALSYAGSNLAGRTIRVSIAEPRKFIPAIYIIFTTFTYGGNSEGPARWTGFQ